MTSEQLKATQERIHDILNSATPAEHASRWDVIWETSEALPFDQASSTPALSDLLKFRDRPSTSPNPNPTPGAPSPDCPSLGYSSLPPPIRADGTRSRILVPGCGRGYDVAMFAAYGYDAYGLEVSSHAADAARKWLKELGERPLEGEYTAAQNEGQIKGRGWGKMVVLCGDFFSDEWLKDVEGWSEDGGGFDVIFDYAFQCALPHALKPKWAKRMASLLREHDTKADPKSETRPNDGVLINVEFGTGRPPSSVGPPWITPPPVYAELLKRPGEEISYDDNMAVIHTDKPEADEALVRVAHYTPKRTHEVFKGNGVVMDCVSFWRRKSDVAERQRCG